MFDPRLRSSFMLAIALALGACTTPDFDASGSGLLDAGSDPEIAARKRRPPADAGTNPPDAPPADASEPAPDPSSPGIISCYSEGSPDTTCTLPIHCCFTNYSAQHNGACTTDACSWGTIECDGPEDCASGQYCCAHALSFGYKIACQDSACGPAPANQELCHPTSSSLAGTCSSAAACVTAYGNDNDLPRTLNICQ